MSCEAFGGKALVRGGKYVTFEGENFIRTVIWEFENIDMLTAKMSKKKKGKMMKGKR